MKQNLKAFFIKIWWWNILIDLILVVLFILFVRQFLYNSNSENNIKSILINRVSLLIGILHLFILLIMIIRQAIKKQWLISVLVIIHAVGLTYLCVTIYVSFILSIGFTGTG